MEKIVGAFEFRRRFGKVLQDIAARGDRYIVERHGEPVAAVVPVEVYEQWKRSRVASASSYAARRRMLISHLRRQMLLLKRR